MVGALLTEIQGNLNLEPVFFETYSLARLAACHDHDHLPMTPSTNIYAPCCQVNDVLAAAGT